GAPGPSAAVTAAVATVVELDLDALVIGAVEAGADGRLALTRAANEAAARPEAARALDPASFAALVGLEAGGELSATQAKAVLAELIDRGGDPAGIARALGFEGLAAGDLARAVDEAIAAHPGEWARYLAGEDKVSGVFVGAVMKATRGRADGKAVTALLRQRRG
ncbi:MAG: Asp-tRNA(Asn)/Glu-tRNA(Gln) amidotransferase subunit GatB, partial [Acidimicrobiales bacterium]